MPGNAKAKVCHFELQSLYVFIMHKQTSPIQHSDPVILQLGKLDNFIVLYENAMFPTPPRCLLVSGKLCI